MQQRRSAILGLLASTALAIVAASANAQAQTPVAALTKTALDRYVANLATLRVEFVQRLTDSRGRSLEAVAGTLVVQRPGRFRWEVRRAGSAAGSAFTQLMVNDGSNVWFYDRELDQVTVKPARSALTATPAMLLSGTVELRQAFTVAAAPRRSGLDWVLVKPKRADAEFNEARLAFDGAELRRMELRDKLGQTAVIEFGKATRNGPVAADELRFTPPADADLIGKPVA
jgi:outer membrane lipoprotein carrier protein